MSSSLDPRNIEKPVPEGYPGTVSYPMQPSQTAEQKAIIPGPGGALTERLRDTTITAPHDENLGGSGRPTDVLTGTPLLEIPMNRRTEVALAAYDLSLGAALVSVVTQAFVPTKPSASSALKEARTYIQEAEEEIIRETAGETQIGQPERTTKKSVEIQNPMTIIDQWLEEVKTSFMAAPPRLTEAQKSVSEAMKSLDSKRIETSLRTLANLETLSLTTAEKTEVETVIREASQKIADANKEGGLPFMDSTFDFFVQKGLRLIVDKPYVGKTDLNGMDKAIGNIASAIGANNAALLLSEDLPHPAFKELFSGNTQQVESQLKTLLQEGSALQKLPKEITQEETKNILHSLSAKIAEKTQENKAGTLQSIDPGELSQELTKLLQEIGVPAHLLAIFQANIVPVLAHKMADINAVQMNIQLFSSDPTKIEKALTELSGIERDKTLTPTQRAASRNYLQALTLALSFMAQIRGLITQLEGVMTSDRSKAKLQSNAAQMALVTKIMDTKIAAANKTYDSMIDKIKTQEVLKVLMPVLSIVLAVLALVLAIAAIFTGGAAAPLAMAAITASILIASATLVFTIADVIVQAVTKKGIWDHALAGVQDEMAKSAIETMVPFAISLLITICTLGAGCGMLLSQIGKAVAQQTMKEILKQILKALQKLFTSMIGKALLSMLIGQVFAGDLIPKLFLKMVQAMGIKDPLVSNIVSMILTVVTMILTMFIALGGVSNLISKIKDTALSKAKQAAELAGKVAAQTAKEAAKTGASAATKAAAAAAQKAAEAAKKAADAVKEAANLAKAAKDMAKLGGAGLERIKALAATAKDSAITAKKAADDLKKLAETALGLSFEKYALGIDDTSLGPDLSAAAGTSKAAVSAATDQVIKNSKTLLSRIADILKKVISEETKAILKILSYLLETLIALVQGASGLQQSDLKLQLAALTLAGGTLEGVFKLTKQLESISLDKDLKAIQEDQKKGMKEWESLVEMVQGFITTIQSSMATFHAKTI